jgi:hypothetical protein
MDQQIHEDRSDPADAQEKPNPYQYLPINEEAQEIRLLILFPGKFTDDLRCMLQIVSFTQDAIPEFEALSYAWGSTGDLVNILIGVEDPRELAVTQNVAVALPYLRHFRKPRIFWIDAICVNQGDLEERSRQVKRMGDIYSKAMRVVVWLGPEGGDSTVAFRTIPLLTALFKLDWTKYRVDPLPLPYNKDYWADKNHLLPIVEREARAIFNLIQRPWFERLWVWQETKLASSTAIIMCGNDTVLWSTFCNAIHCIIKSKIECFEFDLRLRRRLDLVRTLCDRRLGRIDFEILMHETRRSICTDPRDRIYAILSLMDQNGIDIGIEPDYTKSVGEVFQMATLGYVNHYRGLIVLKHLQIHEHHNEMPSWVPDWSVPLRASPFQWGYMVGTSDAFEKAGENGVLKLKGSIVSRIEQVEEFELSDPLLVSNHELRQELMKISTLIGVQVPIDPVDPRLRKLCHVLGAGLFSDLFDPPRGEYPTLQHSERFLFSLLEGHEVHLKDNLLFEAFDEATKLFLAVKHFCYGRSFFKSSGGHIGLAPRGAQAGDLLVTLLECDSATVLKPAENGYFKVVGEAFCEGAMEGEALMAPLPGAFRRLLRKDSKTKGYWTGFIDGNTNTWQPEDPRLEEVSLPAGWGRKSHENEMVDTIFVNERTGEETQYDPRLRVEPLRERGVELQEFKLI